MTKRITITLTESQVLHLVGCLNSDDKVIKELPPKYKYRIKALAFNRRLRNKLVAY